MTRLRHGRAQPGEETPFIELLFVAVGALAILMLTFVAAATRRACDAVDPNEAPGIAEQIKNWAAATRERIASDEREVARQCRLSTPPADPAIAGTALFPAQLARFCRADQEGIIKSAGLTRAEVEEIGRRYQTAARTASECLGRQEARGCLSSASPQAAERVRAWIETTRGETDRVRMEVQRRCGRRIDEAAAAPVLPAELAQYCRGEQQRIVNRAGLAFEELERLGRQHAAVARAAFSCLGEQPIAPCASLSAAALTQRTGELQQWWAEEKRGQAALEEAERRLCGEQRGNPDQASARTVGALMPAMLHGLCRQDAERLLAAAHITSADLDQLAQARRAVSGGINQCSQRTEAITVNATRLEFDVCSAETTRAAPDFFLKTAREVADRVRSHNRIDILGHSDQRRIGAGGCTVNVRVPGRTVPARYQVFTNEMLSWLRANAFRDALLEEIGKDQLLTAFNKRLEDKLVRIYTIGVGEAEPLASEHESRRIEIRFATDARISASSGSRP